MSKSNQQFEHRRKYDQEIKKLYPINTAVKILENNEHVPPRYYITGGQSFSKRINFKDFVKLTK